MRIVQALGSARGGSGARFFIRLVEAFHKRGIAQGVLVRRKAWAGEQLSRAGIAYRAALFAGKLDFVTHGIFRGVLKNPPADIALTWMPSATAACPSGPWVRIGRVGSYSKIDAFAKCDHLIANTPGILAHIRENGWPMSRVSYIPNFVQDVAAKPARRAAFNTPNDAPLILWLGRMTYDKGPDIVVRALAEVPNAYLWMAGAGDYEKQIKCLSAQLGVSNRIRFLGWRDDIHTLLEASDIFVHASRNDAGSNIILEAWSHGRPVVSMRTPGAEHLIADGETGLLAADATPAALAVGLNALIANRDAARRFGEAGRYQFKATYSEEPVVGMYLDLCQRLMIEREMAARRAREVEFGPAKRYLGN